MINSDACACNRRATGDKGVKYVVVDLHVIAVTGRQALNRGETMYPADDVAIEIATVGAPRAMA